MADRLRALVIDVSDNVATAMADLNCGSDVTVESGRERTLMQLAESIAFGHKFAITDIKKGEQVRKYGAPVGIATQDIAMGTHVHVHNVKGQRGGGGDQA